jgi:integrase/recombinase XerD
VPFWLRYSGDALFRAATGGWTLHQLRHSRLTHLAEAGVTGPLFMTKSRHGSVKTLATYAKHL